MLCTDPGLPVQQQEKRKGDHMTLRERQGIKQKRCCCPEIIISVWEGSKDVQVDSLWVRIGYDVSSGSFLLPLVSWRGMTTPMTQTLERTGRTVFFVSEQSQNRARGFYCSTCHNSHSSQSCCFAVCFYFYICHIHWTTFDPPPHIIWTVNTLEGASCLWSWRVS